MNGNRIFIIRRLKSNQIGMDYMECVADEGSR